MLVLAAVLVLTAVVVVLEGFVDAKASSAAGAEPLLVHISSSLNIAVSVCGGDAGDVLRMVYIGLLI